MFEDSALSHDDFLCGRLRLWQPRAGYRAATDPVLLAAAVPARPGEAVLDLGCGVGAASFCLGARVPGLFLTGLELQPAYGALAQRNGAALGAQFTLIEGDVAAPPSALTAQSFDHVIANPPYYAQSGSPSPQPGRDLAMRAQGPLAPWMELATRRLRPGGCLTFILRSAQLPELMAALSPRLGSAALLPLAARQGRPADRFLFQAKKGGRGAFRLLAPFILHEGPAHDGDRENYTAEARQVLREGAPIFEKFR